MKYQEVTKRAADGRKISPAFSAPVASAALIAAALLLGGGQAMACGRPMGAVAQPALKLPSFLQQPPAPESGRFYFGTLVGLWHSEFTGAPGTNFTYQAFDVWHADGTEFESADLPPTLGAVCVGVWKRTGLLTFELNHFGWQWNPASISPPTPIGSFNLIERIELSPDSLSYTGNFDLKPYDLNGVFEPEQEVTGTIASTRITVDQHGAD
jgi:hypothetical protein